MRLKEETNFWERSGKDDLHQRREEAKTQTDLGTLQRSIPASTMNTIRPGPNASNKPEVTAAPNMPSLPPLANALRRDSPQPNSQGNLPLSKAPDATLKREPLPNTLDVKTSRSFHVHNILNPTNNTETQSLATPNDSPQTSVSSLSWRPSDRDRLTQSPSDMSVGSSTLPGLKGFATSAGAQASRLSFAPGPYSNRHYNNVSLGTPSGTIDAKRELFLPTSQTLAPIPRSGAPLLPNVQTGITPPITARTSYGFPQTSPPDRRGTEFMTHASSTRSESPCNSLSSYSQMSKASPGPPHYQPPSGQSHSAQFNQHPAARSTSIGSQGPQIASEPNYGALTGANGQATYQLFTLETDQGPIQVPVDVQAASKMADEKRKRNAGASARFRQRRKEKERESSQTIANLESKIRNLDEEKEYYRMERDYFRGVVYSTPGQQHIPPRIPSPRLRRGSIPESVGHVKNGSWHEEERGNQNGRNTRRRISSSLPYDISQSLSASSKQSPAFSPQAPSYPPNGSQVMHPVARPSMPVMAVTPGAYQPQTPPVYDRPWNSVR